MQRNAVTTAKELIIGDRFYKLKDKTKQVYQMIKHEAKATHFKHYHYFCVEPKFAGGQFEASHAQAIDGITQVVFLRRTATV